MSTPKMVWFVAALALNSPAHATFNWPWDHATHHRHHARPAPTSTPSPEEPKNCDRVNDSIKKLTPDNLKRALDDSNKKQRSTIDDCARAGEAGR